MAPYDQLSDAEIKADAYGLNLSHDDIESLWEVFDLAGISQHFSEHPVAVARDADGDIIGGVTGRGGFMVAGTDAGSSFLFSLPDRLGGFPETLDVPCWEMLREEASCG